MVARKRSTISYMVAYVVPVVRPTGTTKYRPCYTGSYCSYDHRRRHSHRSCAGRHFRFLYASIAPGNFDNVHTAYPTLLSSVLVSTTGRYYYSRVAGQGRPFSSRQSSESGNDTTSSGETGTDATLTKIIHDIDEYCVRQIEALQLFVLMMNSNANESEDPADFEHFRNQLWPLAQREPPNLQDEMDHSLWHVAIRQSKLHTQLAIALLRRGYLNAKSHPWMLGWVYTQGNDELSKKNKEYYMLRYQGLWRYEIVQRMPTLPKVGTIIMYDDVAQTSLVVEYHRNLRTHFCNAPAFAKPLTQPLGKVHVAMGFNDLQILLEHMDGATEPTNVSSGPDHDDTAVPMKFIGYDRSTYSIAKTLVLAQMLQQSSVSPHHIIEAWYSTTWNYETFMLFRYTCISLLKDDAFMNPQQSVTSYPSNAMEEIRKYLHHWAYDAVPISAVEAIQRWLYESSQNGQVYSITCTFHRYNDRQSLLKYFTTGEFNSNHKNQSNTEMVGSLAMWSVPDWAPQPNKSDQDRVNNTVLFQSILDEIKNRPNGDIDVMDAMYHIKLRQVTQLQRAVLSKKLQIDIRYGDIQPLHTANLYLVDEICDLNAATMSWSNLVDYFDVGRFHELANHLSSRNNRNGAGTTHFGYTMNWSTTCFGTFISDYPTKKERQKILLDTIEFATKVSDENGLGQLVTMPTFENTDEQCSELLCRQLRPAWVEYFLDEGKKLLSSNKRIVVTDEMLVHSPIFRTNRSIYLTWTYQ